jgi:hypothetical protein
MDLIEALEHKALRSRSAYEGPARAPGATQRRARLDKNETQIAPPTEDIDPLSTFPDSQSVQLFSGVLDELCAPKSGNDSDFGIFDFQLFFQSTALLLLAGAGVFFKARN